MQYSNTLPSPEEYNGLRRSSGMGHEKKDSQIIKAMQGSLLIVSVYERGDLIGLGRIVGDGGITFAVTDMMVDKSFQRQGIADEILNRMDEWFEKNTDEDCFIMLHANVPADQLYRKHRFEYIEPKKVGMLRK